jgi:hypothetical protein
MMLSVLDRFALLSVLPKESDFLTMRLVSGLHGKVGFSPEEHGALKFSVNQDGTVTWDQGAASECEVALTDAECDLIAMSLRSKNDSRQLSLDHLSIYDKFVLKRE